MFPQPFAKGAGELLNLSINQPKIDRFANNAVISKVTYLNWRW